LVPARGFFPSRSPPVFPAVDEPASLSPQVNKKNLAKRRCFWPVLDQIGGDDTLYFGSRVARSISVKKLIKHVRASDQSTMRGRACESDGLAEVAATHRANVLRYLHLNCTLGKKSVPVVLAPCPSRLPPRLDVRVPCSPREFGRLGTP
jgi:hypothetical protein